MKAIYLGENLLCTVVTHLGSGVILEPIDGDTHNQFVVDFGDPRLILDPTDDEVKGCGNLYTEEEGK